MFDFGRGFVFLLFAMKTITLQKLAEILNKKDFCFYVNNLPLRSFVKSKKDITLNFFDGPREEELVVEEENDYLVEEDGKIVVFGGGKRVLEFEVYRRATEEETLS